MLNGSRRGPTTQGSLFDERIRSSDADGAVGIERAFSVPFIAELALKEKQIQQNIRPVIAVHKWFARRPGTLFRGLLLSEFAAPPLAEAFFRPHQLAGVRVADPFMGGGTPLFEANRLGCHVFGWDVNPMAWWVVRQEIEHLDLEAYEAAARGILDKLEREQGDLYSTDCQECGASNAAVKYFVWTKAIDCDDCGEQIPLLPGYILAHAGRHPRNVLICRRCGELTEAESLDEPGCCRGCGEELVVDGTASRGRCTCPNCDFATTYPRPECGPPIHRMVAIEYHCESCRGTHRGRFFKRPDAADLDRFSSAGRCLADLALRVVPDDEIPDGDETARLHRWGYRRYREMFNPRQLLGLERLGRHILGVEDERVRNALATNFSDLLRYQNMACRYDRRALKSLDVFSVHGFPVGLVQCESNLLGIQRPGTRTNVGSGGWSNIVQKFLKAKQYCDEPFEVRYSNGRKSLISMPGEWIGDRRNGSDEGRVVALHAGSSTEAKLSESSLDAVFTDPPYFANVQYAELMDFCYVWLRRLVTAEAFRSHSTRNPDELTGNVTLNRTLEHFTEGLSTAYRCMGRALKPGRPFVFTYHHNRLDAYYPVAVALLDAGLVCTASLPCPAEMGGSIHIHGTESSIIDTVFVSRSTGRVARRELADDATSIASLVRRDVELLREGSVRVTNGDARCVAFGHLIRLAIWNLRSNWDAGAAVEKKLARIGREVDRLGGWEAVHANIGADILQSRRRGGTIGEAELAYDGGVDDEVPF